MTDAPPQKKPRGQGRPFVKGQSGNPRGTPTGTRPRALLALDALAEGKANAILDAMVERAVGGDVQAATLVLSRAWPARKGRAVPIALPPVRTASDILAALSAVVAAVADGTLSGDEGATIAGLLEAHRKTLEVADLEGRIAALEHGRDNER